FGDRACLVFLASCYVIGGGIIAESARWGDIQKDPPNTYDNPYLAEMNRLYTQYFPVRTATVLGQFVASPNYLYPSVGGLGVTTFYAPTFSQPGGEVASGYNLTIANPNASGAIYYTTDGTDPRAAGGAIVGSPYTGALILTQSTAVKARIYDNGTWSALEETDLFVDTSVHITEIMFNPPAPPAGSAYTRQAFEFIEIMNTGAAAVAMAGMRLSGGIDFVFPNESLAPGERAVVVADEAAFESRYGTGIRILGTYTGSLGNSGEALNLRDAANDRKILDINYKDGWYPLADGDGFSLVAADVSQSRDLFGSDRRLDRTQEPHRRGD
ncbi:MAG: lamin tail domain-containing protein, partial [Planctomycetota bacterium]|nr:lamin tail domain-containing protein [Planctomycetota bacterium]